MCFYLYNYAISISVAVTVASKILSGDKEMLDKYLSFLKTGCDKDPKEVFEIIDIDIEDESVYVNAIKYFDGLLDKFEKLIK